MIASVPWNRPLQLLRTEHVIYPLREEKINLSEVFHDLLGPLDPYKEVKSMFQLVRLTSLACVIAKRRPLRYVVLTCAINCYCLATELQRKTWNQPNGVDQTIKLNWLYGSEPRQRTFSVTLRIRNLG